MDYPSTGTFTDHKSTAIGEMLNYYSRSGGAPWIWPHVEFCARRGIVHMTPDCCILARPVDTREDPDWLTSMGDITGGREFSDLTHPSAGWHILYATGSVTDFFPLCPYPLPWVMWQRGGGRARVHSFEKLYNRIHGQFLCTTPRPEGGSSHASHFDHGCRQEAG